MNQQANQQTAGSRPVSSARAMQDQPTMSFWRYKPGQGYWTRTMTLLGAMTLGLGGAWWLKQQLEATHLYVQWSVAGALALVVFGLCWWLLNKPRIVDFMIATEQEMKKVNWPSRREIIGSTWLVIAGTFMLAILLFGIDSLFVWFFKLINVLKV